MTDQYINAMTQTWNSGATTFAGIRLNVTDSASNAASLLLDLKKDGVTVHSVRKDGLLTSTALTITNTVTLPAQSITRANLAHATALSVLANATNATAAVADLAAGSDHQVLRRSGTALAFGAVALNQSAAVTGVLPQANGGTGSATAQPARDTLRAVGFYATRAAFVTDIGTGTFTTGAVVFAGNYGYVKDGTSTISDMPNWNAFGTRTPYHHGATGDGSANDTTAVQAFLDAGGGLVPEGATHSCTDLTVTDKVVVDCRGTLIKRNASLNANSTFISFASGSEGSVWNGGVIDGNRAALKASYDSLNPSLPAYGTAGWVGINGAVESLTLRGLTIQNHCGSPFWFASDYGVMDGVRTINCGTTGIYGYYLWNSTTGVVARPAGASGIGQRVSNITSEQCDNDGSVLLQHAFDYFRCKDGRYTNIRVIEPAGDTSGISAWFSAHTYEWCEDCVFEDHSAEDFTSDTLQHLGISMLGCVRSQWVRPRVRNIAGQALEVNDCQDCRFTGINLDGMFKVTTAVPVNSDSSLGITLYEGRWNGYRLAKTVSGSKGCVIEGGRVQRFTHGMIKRDNESVIRGVDFVGNTRNGAIESGQDSSDWFSGSRADSGAFIGNRFIANGAAGAVINTPNPVSIHWQDNLFLNNGQDTLASTRQGIVVNGCDRADIVGNMARDDQSWTGLKASFVPTGAATTHTIVMPDTRNIEVNQRILLKNASGSGDVTARVTNIEGDTLTVATSSTALSSTGNTVALTGTWSGSTRTLTGTGGAALTDVPGPVYVTDGSGEWRLVISATGNNSLVLETAFTATLTGATLTALRINVDGIRSQQTGYRLFGAAANTLFADNHAEGNVVEDVNISTVGNLRFGSDYTRRSQTTTDATTENLFSGIPRQHRLASLSTNNTIAITGGASTSYELRLTDSGGSTLATIATGVALTLNTKTARLVPGVNMSADGNLIRAVFNSTAPTAGQITAVAHFRVEGLAELASV